MAKTGADILIEAIQDWGVKVVFGLPGDGINGIMEALRRRKDKIRFIQVRHEESAALMACGSRPGDMAIVRHRASTSANPWHSMKWLRRQTTRDGRL